LIQITNWADIAAIGGFNPEKQFNTFNNDFSTDFSVTI
jgi:hypothetical protein